VKPEVNGLQQETTLDYFIKRKQVRVNDKCLQRVLEGFYLTRW